MKRSLQLVGLLLAVLLILAACKDEEQAQETPEATIAAVAVLPTATATVAPIATPLPPPTSTIAPTPTLEPTATATVTPTPAAAGDAAGGAGQAQDPGAAATAGAAAAQAGALMAPWQGIIGVAVFNQAICTTLQTLAQTGQQGGLAALGVSASLIATSGWLQSVQQQLAGLMGTAGAAGPLAALQADQTALADLLGRWSGGQMDAATAGAALQVICGSTNTTLGQTQQSAQDAGLSEEQVGSMLDQSKRDAAGSIGGILP